MAKRIIPPVKKDLGFYMRVFRAQRHLSQLELAELLDVKPSMVSLLESGQRAPGRDVAKVLMELTGAPWEVVLAEPQPQPARKSR